MFKYIAVLALIVAVAYSTGGTTCADHPLLPLLKTFISSHDAHMADPKRKNKKEGDAAFDGSGLITAFEGRSGDDVVTGLNKCSDYNDGASCCVADLTAKFPKLTRGFFRRQLNKPPKQNKVLRALKKFGTKCGVADFDTLDPKQESKSIINEFKKCQKSAMTAEVNLIRGTLCTLCTPKSDWATKFTGEGTTAAINVVATALDAYETKMQTGLTCFDDAQTKFATLVKSLTAKMTDAKCEKYVTRINNIVDGTDQKFGKSKSCKGSVRPLQDSGCAQETGDDNTDIPEAAPTRRMLSTGGYTVSASGFSADAIYEVDTTENDELNALDYDEEVTPVPESGSILGFGLMFLGVLAFAL